MAQRDARLIGGVYRMGPTMTTGTILTTCTAHHRYANEMVGLSIVEVPPSFSVQQVQQTLRPLEQRRSVQSTHVLQVHNWGIEGNRAYIATDPPHGMTLRYVMDNEPISIQRSLDLVQQIVQGVQDLHEQGIIGLDLRPQLITVDATTTTDHVQLDDIGLRTILHALGYSSQSPDDLGNLDPRYTSPEAIQNQPLSAASDIYEIGLLLFELVTGRLPFVGRTTAETGIMQCSNPVPQLSQFTHDAPKVLQSIIERSLAKEPDARYASASAMLTDLTAASQPLGSMTNVMPAVDDDATVRASQTEAHKRIEAIGSLLLPTLPNEQGVYANLCYERTDGEVQHLPLLKTEVVVGRADPKHSYRPDIDLTIFDPKATVSRRHARILFQDQHFYIEDTHSSNRTRVGNLLLVPSQPILLQHGDRLRFGSVSLEFRIPGMSKVPMPHQEE